MLGRLTIAGGLFRQGLLGWLEVPWISRPCRRCRHWKGRRRGRCRRCVLGGLCAGVCGRRFEVGGGEAGAVGGVRGELEFDAALVLGVESWGDEDEEAGEEA